MSAFAQFERDSIIARVKDGARARAERGLGKRRQASFRLEPDPAHRCHVLINENEKPYVQMIFEKFLELGTIAKLQQYLNSEGHRTKAYVTQDGKVCRRQALGLKLASRDVDQSELCWKARD